MVQLYDKGQGSGCNQTLRPLTVSKTDLKDDGLVVLAEVECEDIGVHEGLTAQTQNVHGLLQELDLDP